MDVRPLVSLYSRTLIAVGLAILISQSPMAADNVPPEVLNVKVLPDRYVAAGRPFADVAALAAWAKPILIRKLWLDTCGPASTKQLLAAVERFQSVYPEGIQIRALPPEEVGCESASINAARMMTELGGRPTDAEYLEADELGRSVLP